MRTRAGRWTVGVVALAVASALGLGGCAESMSGGDKAMMKKQSDSLESKK